MSNWEEYQLETKIRNILQSFQYEEPDHFGQPFVSAYQIAIAFVERHPDEFKALGEPLGGAGTNENHSLAQYIARELSQRIKRKHITDIEGAWLHKDYVRQLDFIYQRKPVIASGGNLAALSMFRLRQP